MYLTAFSMLYNDTYIYSWNTLVHKNFEIERACVELEGELASLKEQAKLRLLACMVTCTCFGPTLNHFLF